MSIKNYYSHLLVLSYKNYGLHLKETIVVQTYTKG